MNTKKRKKIQSLWKSLFPKHRFAYFVFNGITFERNLDEIEKILNDYITVFELSPVTDEDLNDRAKRELKKAIKAFKHLGSNYRLSKYNFENFNSAINEFEMIISRHLTLHDF
jgi:hypothetical protein